MPIQHAIWQVADQPAILPAAKLASEQLLESMIVREPRILSSEWMLIGQQEVTSHGGRIDLLAIAPDGSLVLIELKRDRTPREIVAQALDYASWVVDLTADRIVAYLNARDIAINVVFFKVFEHGGQQLLSRAWMIDPGETQANAAATNTVKGEAKEPWNGEFYVSFGSNEHRSWEDARRYGYISGGGGTWYSQTLKLLSPGDRVWVKIPQTGFVGVGEVTESVQSAKDFTVTTPEGDRPALDVLQHGPLYRATADDPEQAEYFVRVKWLDAVDVAHAFNEVGLFGNQKTVCQPRAAKWRYTVAQLKLRLPIRSAAFGSRLPEAVHQRPACFASLWRLLWF